MRFKKDLRDVYDFDFTMTKYMHQEIHFISKTKRNNKTIALCIDGKYGNILLVDDFSYFRGLVHFLCFLVML